MPEDMEQAPATGVDRPPPGAAPRGCGRRAPNKAPARPPAGTAATRAQPRRATTRTSPP